MKTILSILIMMLLISPAAASGFTVMSISTSEPISNNESLSRANIIVNIIADGAGQSISGTINPEGFGIHADPFELSISSIQERLSYPILNQGTLWKYDYYYYDAKDFWNGAQCEPAPAYCFKINIPDRFGIGIDRVLIITRIPAGSYGLLQNPDLSFSGTAKLNLNGTEYTQDIGSGELANGQVIFKGLGSMRWTGSLVTGRGTPNPNLYTATHKKDAPAWNIAHKTTYDVYEKSLYETDTFLSVWKDQDKVTGKITETHDKTTSAICKDLLCSDVINKLTVHNANVDTLLSQKTSIDYSAVTAKSTITQSSNIVDIIDRQISYPNFVLILKADKLNVRIPVGIPKILDVNTQPYNAGDNDAYVNVQVQNTGTGQGTFQARIDGNPLSSKISLTPQETGTLTLHLNFGLDASNKSFKGLVEVHDINSGAQDIREFQIEQKQAKTFIPNTTREYNEVISKSDETGMIETNILDCSSGIYRYEKGKYQCHEIGTIDLIPATPKESQASSTQQIPLKIPDSAQQIPDWLIVLIIIIISLIMVISLINYIINISHRTIRNARRKSQAGVLVLVLIIVIFYLIYTTDLWTIIIGGLKI